MTLYSYQERTQEIVNYTVAYITIFETNNFAVGLYTFS